MDDAGADLCPHCDPYPNKASHLHEKIENVLFPLVHFFINPFEATIKNFPRFNEALKNFVGNGVLKTLLICGVLKEVGVEDSDDGLYNRSLVVAREAPGDRNQSNKVSRGGWYKQFLDRSYWE